MRYPVYFVVLPNALLLDLAGPAEALACVNRMDGNVSFAMRYVSAASPVMTSTGLALTGLEPLPATLEPEALVFVAGTIGAGIALDALETQATLAWLRTVHTSARQIVCICTGALVAAAAGLLRDTVCTTHHTECDRLRALEPTADVRDNRLFVADGHVATSAGVTAGIDLTLYLIAELAGSLCATRVARNLVVYMRRTGADPQLSPWLEGRNHVHPSVHDVQDAIIADPARAWEAAELAHIGRTSPRHLARLFREHAGTNLTEYLHRLRIALARELLSQTNIAIEQVAERSGFGSSRHLRRVWRKFDDEPPRSLRLNHRLPLPRRLDG